MTNKQLLFLEVRGDRVLALAGESSEEKREQFAREAESLQSRAHQLGLTLGMTVISSIAATYEGGGIGFRFAKSSSETFDAKGVFITGEKYAAHSIRESIK